MSRSDELERLYGKPYINEDLLNIVIKSRHYEDSEVLHDDSFKVWEKPQDELSVNEKRYLSELGRDIEKYTKDEFAVLVYVAIMNYPEMVFQLMMEEYLSVVNKASKRRDENEDNEDV